MKIKNVLLHVLYLTVIAAYAYIIGCPVKRISGFDCPFCGMTRAYTAFFCGDVLSALEYHELFFLGVPFMLGLAHLRILKKRRAAFVAVAVFCALCTAAFLTRYLILLLI